MDADLPAEVVKALGGGLAARTLLGPSGKIVGSKLASATEWSMDNAVRVLGSAMRRTDPGKTGVPTNPRVLSKAMDEALTTDDEVMAHYLGGVLASSRSPDGVDDRGVAYVGAMGLLSAAALRLHYLLYAQAARALHGTSLNVYMGNELNQKVLYYELQSLGYSAGPALIESLGHGMFTLGQADLINNSVWAFGDAAHLRAAQVPFAAEPGLKYGITFRGIELFMWGMGLGDRNPGDFLNLDPDAIEVEGMPLVGQAVLVSSMVAPTDAVTATAADMPSQD